MNKTSLFTATAFAAVVGLGSYTIITKASAQTAPVVPMSDAVQPMPHGGMHEAMHEHMGKMGMGMEGEREHQMHAMHEMHDMGLFAHVADKKLTVADVTLLAQAMLLHHGNHEWKVTNVAENQDKTVSFAFSTSNGGAIARFSMDTATGKVHRVS